ncbi:WD repeat and FYVE domain-containing protein 3-like [Trypanosoma rangeli]|uniref:WD repeat and FYVE domain-containing protein 3-like n=1 Tax=Trypanosoma rangeli TaxID=5698 RepID=A0A3R7LPA2_TRYRA|nr:WD repeat and FYVE domain-containing protein 3-like [Trypanosoma rangeli]RNF00799.1 WD repeat and FYVE domain-containing protein 3-like [Trypanosoma rangeli]|eukprot:RNF00799.1 WD repeat and FYVE domain-containing protein 3-like [Trypanosoma rangeli]
MDTLVTLIVIFVSFTVKKDMLAVVLINELVVKTKQNICLPETSYLLLIFTSVVRDSSGAGAASKGSFVHLCLFFLQKAERSTQVENDVHLIGILLALMCRTFAGVRPVQQLRDYKPDAYESVRPHN